MSRYPSRLFPSASACLLSEIGVFSGESFAIGGKPPEKTSLQSMNASEGWNVAERSSRPTILSKAEDSYKEKKIISISPGGYKGFYELGVCKYIKENYNLTDYVFSGASAGAWNSLILCFRRDIREIQDKVLDERIYQPRSIWGLEKLVKQNLLSHFTAADFELDKLFVGVTTVENYKSRVVIYSNFTDLEDAINACCASSHIPFITGGMKHIYRNVLTFDGGFSRYPYLLNGNVVFNITPTLWNDDPHPRGFRITDYTTLFSRDQYSFDEMIEQGYANSKKNKAVLDKIFL